MALIRCPECGREISDRAYACPGCGFPVRDYLESDDLKEEYGFSEYVDLDESSYDSDEYSDEEIGEDESSEENQHYKDYWDSGEADSTKSTYQVTKAEQHEEVPLVGILAEFKEALRAEIKKIIQAGNPQLLFDQEDV